MAGGGTKIYVMNGFGRLACGTPGIVAIPPAVPGSTPETVGTSQDNIDDDSHEDADDDTSASSLDVSHHTQFVADALTCAGISTVIVGHHRPKSLFSDDCSPTTRGCAIDRCCSEPAKPPSGRRGLLAKFDEVDGAPSTTRLPSLPTSPSKASPPPASTSNSSASTRTGSSTGGDGEYIHADYVHADAVQCGEGEGLNLRKEMNLERRVDAGKGKRRVGATNGKGKKKKRRRLA